MLDGVYQSVICFYITYLLFRPANFATKGGQQVDDTAQMGVYVACAAIVVVNIYFLLNTYRWDWLILLIVAISILLIWWWTGVYAQFRASNFFYKSPAHVFGQLSFWTTGLLTVIVCLIPRFTAKAYQKIFRPRDIDIIREQVRQGKFKYLDHPEPTGSASPSASPIPSDLHKPSPPTRTPDVAEDQRPIYPPSVSATATTYNPRSHNGSDGTDYTGHRESLERQARASVERPRPSYDRMRSSMDRVRPSFEASHDFTSAALLTRIESSHCHPRLRRDHTNVSVPPD